MHEQHEQQRAECEFGVGWMLRIFITQKDSMLWSCRCARPVRQAGKKKSEEIRRGKAPETVTRCFRRAPQKLPHQRRRRKISERAQTDFIDFERSLLLLPLKLTQSH